MSSRRPIRVVFLLFYFEAWDALDAIYRRMLADERFEPIVVSIPRKLTGDLNFGREARVSKFLDSQGIAHVRLSTRKGKKGLAYLTELAPDYIFLNYPWQRNYKLSYRIQNLAKIAKVAYVPYFSTSLVTEPGVEGIPLHQYMQPTHRQAHMVFVNDADVREAFTQIGRADHVYLTGTPKIDALLAARDTVKPFWPLPSRGDEGRFKLLWAPHHSFGPGWLNFGHFVDTCEHMLQWATKHPEADVVFRPHPFLFGTLRDEDLMTEKQVERWRSAWDALPNTCTDKSSSFPELFLASDALLTDGVSFLAEYPLVTGRPSIFWEKPDHWAFTAMGEKAAAASVTVSSANEVDAALQHAMSGQLPSRREQIEALIHAVSPNPGRAAETIVELVAKDFS
ncbi:MAG: hypothetical protein RIR88_343 [Actinomycetota bacterium]